MADPVGRARGPATLIDVARLADVHPSTASRALNASTRDRVSAATAARILDAAQQLGYQPNSLARGLKMSRTFTVGMLIPDLTNPLFPPIVRGIEDRLRESGWTLILANTDNDDTKERSLLDAMTARRVDGLILATARRDYPLLDDIAAAGIPTVMVNRTTDTPTVASVTNDDHSGIGQAIRHLTAQGHRHIAHIAGTQTVSTGLNRYHAFLTWTHTEGLHVTPQHITFAPWFQEHHGEHAFNELFERGVPFTAAVCANDLLALGGYDAIRQRGLHIPNDISVVGYNDIPFTGKFSPPLTSIRIPHYHIGHKAADVLLQTIEEPDGHPTDIRLKPQLVIRGSTAPPNT